MLRRITRQSHTEYKRSVAKPLQTVMRLEMERYALMQELKAAIEAAKIVPCSCEHEHEEDSRRCPVAGCSCEKGNPDWPAEKDEQYRVLSDQLRDLNEDELQPPLIRWGVKRLKGLTLDMDGVEVTSPTPDQLLSDGPPELVEEIAAELVNMLLLTPDETKNSASPTTTGEQVDGATKASDVPAVEKPESTKNATVMADFFQSR